MRFAMSLSTCYQYGTAYSASGWSRARVIAELKANGAGKRTIARILKAFDAQEARG